MTLQPLVGSLMLTSSIFDLHGILPFQLHSILPSQLHRLHHVFSTGISLWEADFTRCLLIG